MIKRLRSKYWVCSRREESKMNWDLDKNSVVFEIGANVGKNTVELIEKYNCNIYAFEPVKEIYEKLKYRVMGYKPKNLRLYNFGLADETSIQPFLLDGVSSSVYGIDKPRHFEVFQNCELVGIKEFIDSNKIEKIDLMIVDIEGSEYNFLKKLISSGYIEKVERLMVQFHRTYPNYKSERKKIRKLLRKTHYNKYTFPFIWEAWIKK